MSCERHNLNKPNLSKWIIRHFQEISETTLEEPWLLLVNCEHIHPELEGNFEYCIISRPILCTVWIFLLILLLMTF